MRNTPHPQSGYPFKLLFQIPCIFPVQRQIFPVTNYVICDYYIHKTDLADLSSFKSVFFRFSKQISKYRLSLESGNLQPKQTKFPLFSLCFGKISKFPVFTLTGIFLGAIFPVFPVHCVPCPILLCPHFRRVVRGDVTIPSL